ncbi:hypothetical protein F443_16313 [Phytophthora nicotianae P1569]|uniref:Uncharacterized protein n=1 Tax=Phytophthora nicotianae P1569 TaxID=1317065 RepID=V9EGZ6_PHYNI|nr:hypothetical protein F443_16313 [Phytophthora nicotianae P1569]
MAAATATTSAATQGKALSRGDTCTNSAERNGDFELHRSNRLVYMYRRFNDARQDSACGRIRVRSCGKPAARASHRRDEYARWACCVVNLRAPRKPMRSLRRNAVDFLVARTQRRPDEGRTKKADRLGGLLVVLRRSTSSRTQRKRAVKQAIIAGQ